MFFSVIVPIYKVEAYLRECVDSILSQSFADFELILVDDGSPDGCPALCDAYAAQDARISVIHKENGGLVSARQTGMRAAAGDYIIHVDGDDALAAGALEAAHTLILQSDADIVTFSYFTCSGSGARRTVDEIADAGVYDARAVDEKLLPKLLMAKDMTHLFYFLWGKAIRRSLALSPQLAVPQSVSLGEDVCALVPCYLAAKTVCVSRTPVYLYRERQTSMSNAFSLAQFGQIAAVVEHLKTLTADRSADFSEQIARYACFMSFVLLVGAARCGCGEQAGAMRDCILHSVLAEEIQAARFTGITVKSRIAVFLLKKRRIKAAYRFLRVCEQLKHLGKKKG